MTEPFYNTDPNPSEQNPLDDPDLFADPDPLLETGWFIDPETAAESMPDPEPEAPEPETTTTTAPGAASPIMATPLSQRRPKRPVEETSEHPGWLPKGWRMEVRVRNSGATAGTTDRHHAIIDLIGFPEEKHLILVGEKAIDDNIDKSLPSQDEYQESAVDNCTYNVDGVSHDSFGKIKIDSEVQTAAISLLLLRARNKGPEIRNMSSRLIERPEWLPLDWDFVYKVRSAGFTAGRTDKYFISPSGQRFRSKVEVLHYLETGSKRKNNKKSKTDSEATPSKSPSDQKKKKSRSNPRDFSDLKFDFENPPQSVTWARAGSGDCPDDWVPSIGSTTLPESIRTEWGTAYSRIRKLDKSN